MSIKEEFKRYNEVTDIFRCPLCQTAVAFENINSIVCEQKHCFDLSKYGYINFLPNQRQTKYTKGLFESRRSIFDDGFYVPLYNGVETLLNEYFTDSKNINVLDVGCGEGYYSIKLSDADPRLEVYAIDNVKDAIVLGAKEHTNVKWIVGDLANMPFATESMDLLLNIFAPSNYSEFLRIMRPGGYLFKVVPGEKYLQELRDRASEQLLNKHYSNEPVLQYFKEHMACEKIEHLSYTMPVDSKQINDFAAMTPMMFHVNKDELILDGITEITLDFDIIVGRK